MHLTPHRLNLAHAVVILHGQPRPPILLLPLRHRHRQANHDINNNIQSDNTSQTGGFAQIGHLCDERPRRDDRMVLCSPGQYCGWWVDIMYLLELMNLSFVCMFLLVLSFHWLIWIALRRLCFFWNLTIFSPYLHIILTNQLMYPSRLKSHQSPNEPSKHAREIHHPPTNHSTKWFPFSLRWTGGRSGTSGVLCLVEIGIVWYVSGYVAWSEG